MSTSVYNKASLLVVGAAIGMVVLGGFAVYFVVGGIVSDYQNILSQKEEIARITADENAVAEFAEQLEVYAEEFQNLDQLFINAPQPLAFLDFLESLGSMNIAPGNPRKQKGDQWTSLDFRLSFGGSYEDVVRIIEKLEHAPFLVKVREVSLRGNGPTANASITLGVFAR